MKQVMVFLYYNVANRVQLGKVTRKGRWLRRLGRRRET